jgi:hypothetical protein
MRSNGPWFPPRAVSPQPGPPGTGPHQCLRKERASPRMRDFHEAERAVVPAPRSQGLAGAGA